ncbi:MAG: LuxR C-terminal-related transcriptional regulator [Gaiellaceae bacterium]
MKDATLLALQLDVLGGDIHGSLEHVSVPMYLLDRDGKIMWLNDAGDELIPDGEGRRFTEILAPELADPARRRYAQRMAGQNEFVDHETVLKAPGGGGHAVEISSAPLRDGHRIVGVFGVFRTHRPVAPGSGGPAPTPRLTPRQREVLDMLGAGLTTRQMAERTGLSIETIRNHTRGVLRELGAKSRLEAVLVAHRQGLLD